MFGSLRKKLKETIDKVSKSIISEEKVEAGKERIKEEIIEQQEKPFAQIEKIEKEKTSEEMHTLRETPHTCSQTAKKSDKESTKELLSGLVEERQEEEKKFSSGIVESDARKTSERVKEFPETKKEELKQKEKGHFVGRLFGSKGKKTPEQKLMAKKIPAERKGIVSSVLETTITEEDANKALHELELALLENDVAVEVAERIANDVKAAIINQRVRRGAVQEAIRSALRKSMLTVLSQESMDLENMIEKKDGVFTIIFLGFNGTGKTTTVAKFAKRFLKYKPVVAAADTFRAASIEQLEEHGRRAGFRVVKHHYGSDSAAVIFDAKKAAAASGSKLVIADTAGRSHSNVNLMDELRKIVRVNKPDLKILVLDSLTGNDIYEQARLFDNAVGVNAIILTKADVYDKGGAALSAAYTIKRPILYLGVGQEYGDLKVFSPEEIVDSLLGD